MSTDKSIVSFLPLQYQQEPMRIGLDAQGSLIAIASDLAKALGYQDATHALRILDEDEKGSTNLETLGGMQRVLYVTESGVYHLIFGSKHEEAKLFRRWVTKEILPTLRRTGTYTIPTAQDQLTFPAPLTSHGHLPPPPQRIREHAEVSTHLLAVWTLLRDTGEWLSNQEIAQRADVAPRTARAHTRYLLYLGLIDLEETFPRHIYHISASAEKRNSGAYQRLNTIAQIVQERLKY